MFRTSVYFAVFLAGLCAACWIGAGYVGTNPVGLAVALVIAACYTAGGVELFRYRQATAGLGLALADMAAAQDDPGPWLQRVPAGLRNAVRLRVQGERIALPAPALTPYLVGLLVLLGMLGTLLGMMATLRGTGLALESATDLQAIRGSLGAPVEGLAVAFGTSIAGVATSAMLGLLSALCRRERLQVVQQLDTQLAGPLHHHSQAWQRSEALRLAQAQTGLMPALVEQLQAMTAAIEQRSQEANAQLLARQESFHAKADAEHARLAAAIEQALSASVAASAQAVGAALQPVMQQTLRAIAAETGTLQRTVGEAVQRQLDSLESGFQSSRSSAAEHWTNALAAQQHSHTAMTEALRGALDRLAEQHDQRALSLLEALSARLDANADRWSEAQQAQQHTHQALVGELQGTLAQFSAQHQQQAGSLVEALGTRLEASAERWNSAQLAQQQTSAALLGTLGGALQQFVQRHDQHATALVEVLSSRLEASTDSHAAAWREALERQEAASHAHAERNQQALSAAAGSFDTHASTLVQAMQQSHAALQDALEARDGQRLGAWSDAFSALSADLGRQWAQTGEQVAQRQQQICDALESTARQITEHTQAHASDTIAEISRLVQVASEAPRAAAEVVAELRQKLSDSMVRDTAMLDERSRLLATLETLLDAVNHASTEQRSAVDALVTTSADLLERVGARFTEHLAGETGKLGEVAAQLTGSAVEVASLADAFGGAMQVFGSASAGLGERLEQISGALDASLLRSDEQLAYYVAQAREVIDLSVLSQQQIIEELQQLSARRGAGKAGAAAV
ncbi:DUF802 domain-containing protein [Stenotrophomonas rhizophila]|uniref:DUF802 domain-containing protein n=1 Tax=Stenotrophomonas rhizophila TaxID=216778 RepID=UPI001E641293|nr:DUF802 domain-containing protein [Stenotrophomonas rhizophila]MCC7633960.1 DUF802 domain-containing protein [Stenotrophomonas rhizophila]MCC7663294.1 DUF802 domain-containing protein [Stenotrophomonas rhizophila]